MKSGNESINGRRGDYRFFSLGSNVDDFITIKNDQQGYVSALDMIMDREKECRAQKKETVFRLGLQPSRSEPPLKTHQRWPCLSSHLLGHPYR